MEDTQEKLDKAMELYAKRMGYPAQITNPDTEVGGFIDNPETYAQHAAKFVLKHIMDMAKAQELDIARITAKQNMEAEIAAAEAAHDAEFCDMCMNTP